MPRRSFCSEPPCARDRGLGRLNPAERKRRERARKIRSVAEVQELVRLGPRLPEHIEPYAQFLREREGRAPSLREAVKAYTITRSSVRRQGRKNTTVCSYFPELAQIRPHPGERSVRPEDAFSVLLLTPWGRRYLDAAERGRFDRQAAKQIVDRMGCFGMTEELMDDMRFGAEGIPRLYPALRDRYQDRDAASWIRWVREAVAGIGASKAGFFRSLLGRGDVPTFDAREIVLWMREPREPSPEDVAVLTERMRQWPIALRPEDEPHRPHLVHHALWDAAEGTSTTHAESIEAMRFAGRRRRYL